MGFSLQTVVIPRIFASCSAVGTATSNDGSFAAFEGMGKRRRLLGFHVDSEVGMVRKFREILPPALKGMIAPIGTAARR